MKKTWKKSLNFGSVTHGKSLNAEIGTALANARYVGKNVCVCLCVFVCMCVCY